MYFGEFLLEKKAINEEQLLEALSIQMERLPSFLRVIKNDKKISSKELVGLVRLQVERNTDLPSLLLSEGLYNKEEIDQLYKKQSENNSLFGEILVELKFITGTQLEQLLIEFFTSSQFLENKSNNSLVSNESTSKNVNQEAEISMAALESLRELGISPHELENLTSNVPQSNAVSTKDLTINMSSKKIFIKEFLNVYDDKLNVKLMRLHEIIQKSFKEQADLSNYYNSLYRVIHLINGVALAAELNIVSDFIAKWERALEKNFSLSKEDLLKWSDTYLPLLDESLKILWDIRQAIDHGLEKENITISNNLIESKDNIIKSL